LPNRYKDNASNDPLPPEAQRVMTAWADTEGAYRDHYDDIRQALGRTMAQSIMNRNRNFAVDAEHALATVAPDLLQSMDELRRGIDAIIGWKIDWRHRVRGDVIDNDITVNSDESIVSVRAIWGPDEYELIAGWVRGSQIGPDRITGSPGAWIAVALEEDDETGSFFNLADMYEVELTAPPTAD
jgi:hypothetical protein